MFYPPVVKLLYCILECYRLECDTDISAVDGWFFGNLISCPGLELQRDIPQEDTASVSMYRLQFLSFQDIHPFRSPENWKLKIIPKNTHEFIYLLL